MRRWMAAGLLLSSVLYGGLTCGYAQNTICPTFSKGLDPVAFETITVSTVAIGFTAATINAQTAAAAFITVEAQPLRWTAAGGAPTSTSGHLIEPPPAGNADSTRGQWFCGRTAILGVRFIRSSSSDSTVRATYYRAR